MLKDKILATVIDIVVEQMHVPKSDIKLESRFEEDLNADSLDIVEFVMEFEDRLGLSIPDAEAETLKTVQLAVDYIYAHQGQIKPDAFSFAPAEETKSPPPASTSCEGGCKSEECSGCRNETDVGDSSTDSGVGINLMPQTTAPSGSSSQDELQVKPDDEEDPGSDVHPDQTIVRNQ